jgi:hypothetical protein
MAVGGGSVGAEAAGAGSAPPQAASSKAQNIGKTIIIFFISVSPKTLMGNS